MADLAPQLIAAIKGDKGLYPVNGGYVSTVAYRKDTILRDNGSQWRALQLVPPGTLPAEGAYWTKFIDGTPVADAAQVAADRVLSQAAAATATASLDSVSALALLVGGYATATQINAQSAAAVSGLANLSAAARAILLDTNNVAVHVYDTARDHNADWIGKLNNSLTTAPLGTSMRGSKAQFPGLAIIAAQGIARQIVFYDADDPTCPMWWTLVEGATNMSLTNTVPLVTGISAKNGLITLCAGAAGFLAIDLIADKARVYRSGVTPNCGVYQGNLADCNSGKGYPGTLPSWFGGPPVTLTNGATNHMVLAVAPGTLPNPDRFGLPNPMCITAGATGILVIRPDGVTVASSSTTAFGRVSLDKNFNLFVTAVAVSSFVWVADYPGYMSTSFALQGLSSGTSPTTVGIQPTAATVIRAAGSRIAYGAATAGLSLLTRHPSILANSAVAFIDEWRNTGHLIGTTRAAYTESSRILSTLQSVEMLQNGGFDTDISGWNNISIGSGFTPPSVTGGRVLLQRVDGSNRGIIDQIMPTVAGQTYRCDVTVSGAACLVWMETSRAGGQLRQIAAPVGTTTFWFRATNSASYARLVAQVDGTTGYVDNISVKAVIADHTFAAANCLEITGTLNRSVVATGAELAAINGFSAANYAQAPYSSTLDPGTGELSVACAVVINSAATTWATLLDRAAVSGTGAYYRLFLNGTGCPSFVISDGTTTASVTTGIPLPAGAHRLRGIRRVAPARIEIEVDGVIMATTAASGVGSLSNASAVLRLGLLVSGGLPMAAAGPGLALFNIAMTAPSIEQMRTAFADEIQMFQANAKSLLQGGSTVQDLAYDPDTDTLAVAKAAGGTDLFQGLVNRGTVLSSVSANKFRNSYFFGAVLGGVNVGKIDGGPIPGINNGVTITMVGAGPGYVDIRVNGTATATGQVTWSPQALSGTPAGPGETWTCSQEEQIIAGSMANFTTHELRLDRLDAGSATVGSTGTTTFTPTATNARYSTTVTTEAGTASLQLRWIFRFNVGAVVDVTMRLRRPQTEKAAAFSSFVDALTISDNHKAVSFHDGNLIVATTAGADVIMPSIALRERLRARRQPVAANDPSVSRFNGRITTDATPTFIGDPIYVPEGGKVDAIMSVTAAVPGGTATELFTTLLKVRANRDIGAAAATVFYSVISGSPSLPDKTTGTMDLIVASMGGGWIGVRATGKAATTIEWFGEQQLTRAA